MTAPRVNAIDARSPDAAGSGWTLTSAAIFAMPAAALLVPMLLSTVAGLLSPRPWRVDDPESLWGVLAMAGLAWIVFPLVVGLWSRTWWWGLVCVLVTVATAVSWDGGRPIFMPRLGLDGAVPAPAAAMPAGLGLALLAGASGLAGAAWGRRMGADVRAHLRSWTALCLVLAAEPTGVGLTFSRSSYYFARPDSAGLVLGELGAIVLLVAATLGALLARSWLRQFWWPIACAAGYFVMAMWGFNYTAALDRLSWAAFGVLFGGVLLALASGVCATIGVIAGNVVTRRNERRAAIVTALAPDGVEHAAGVGARVGAQADDLALS